MTIIYRCAYKIEFIKLEPKYICLNKKTKVSLQYTAQPNAQVLAMVRHERQGGIKENDRERKIYVLYLGHDDRECIRVLSLYCCNYFCLTFSFVNKNVCVLYNIIIFSFFVAGLFCSHIRLDIASFLMYLAIFFYGKYGLSVVS